MPGRVFPADGPRAGPESEHRVYDALSKQLPNGWTAWHSLKLRRGRSWEGEGDFVIAAPDIGLLTLEVKGGEVSLRGGHWYQYDRRLKKPPRDQALGLAHQLAALLKDEDIEAPPFGAGCVFPDTAFSAGPQTGDLAGLVIGERELRYLGNALPEMMKRALPDRPAPRSRRWVERLHELWGDTWVPRVTLDARVADAERRLISLDEQQLAMLDMFEDNKRALVNGPAGSGKSIVARELCRRRALAGQRVLYLCFTSALARVVDEQMASVRQAGGSVDAAAVRSLAFSMIESSGEQPDVREPGFWKLVSLQAALDHLPEQKPDLIVVDEAQDLSEEDWALVEALAGEGGIWAFHDPAQAFWRERSIPQHLFATAARVSLQRQRRNPEPIEQFARLYLEPSGTPNVRPDPAVLSLAVVDGSVEERVVHELNEVRRAGVEPDDIAVITLGGQTRSELFGRESIGSHRVARADDEAASTSIVLDTFLRFKGLERPVVILTELSAGASFEYETRMFIGLTRATASCRIVASRSQVDSDPRLAALLAE
jgi:hypothetical protein